MGRLKTMLKQLLCSTETHVVLVIIPFVRAIMTIMNFWTYEQEGFDHFVQYTYRWWKYIENQSISWQQFN